MHKTLSGLTEGINLAVVKASEGDRHAVTQGHLEGAELRGVAICALAGKYRDHVYQEGLDQQDVWRAQD